MLPFTKVKKVGKVGKVIDTSHIARPPNCFMIWSRQMRKIIYSGKLQVNNANISKHLGLLWMNMSDDEKIPYIIEADKVKYEHKIKNPNYKYTPKTKSQKNTNKSNALNTVNKIKCKRVYKAKKLNIILNKESQIELNTDFLIKEPDYFLEVQEFYENICKKVTRLTHK